MKRKDYDSYMSGFQTIALTAVTIKSNNKVIKDFIFFISVCVGVFFLYIKKVELCFVSTREKKKEKTTNLLIKKKKT